MTFEQFFKKQPGHNLYIIRKDGIVLYVGISTVGAWMRWFSGPSPHIFRNMKGEWIGGSEIGEVIVRNLPDSLQWTVKLQRVNSFMLKETERELIHKLRPLFNDTHREALTKEENKLIKVFLRENEAAKREAANALPLPY